MYCRSIIPTTDKKKSRGRKGTYCQRLARHLDRLDENPELWMNGKAVPLPPFLKLPPELRQTIVYLVLDDDELSLARPNSTTATLELVCKQFAADLPAVMRMWDARVAALSRLGGFEKTVMSALIKDMMGPLEVASAVLNNQKRLFGSRAQRKASSRRNMQIDGSGLNVRRQRQKEAVSTLRALNPLRHRSGGRPATEEEKGDMKRWRRARVEAIGSPFSKVVIPRSATRAGSNHSSIAGASMKTRPEADNDGSARNGPKILPPNEEGDDGINYHTNTNPGLDRESMLKAYMRSARISL